MKKILLSVVTGLILINCSKDDSVDPPTMETDSITVSASIFHQHPKMAQMAK